MATSSCAPSDLPLEQLSLYHVSDPSLSSVFIFYGPVSTTNATVSSSRAQAHILTPAGFQSYPRITISPAAPLYAAVNHLPREKQGDEVCRGLAVSMLKYFADLSDPAKECLHALARAGKPGGQIPKIFDEIHAADLANRMVKVENTTEIVRDIRGAFQERKVPWVDIDVVLPAGTIRPTPDDDVQSPDVNPDFEETVDAEYGQYSSLIRALGGPMFLPTSRLKRAPSQPTNVSRSKFFSQSQKQSLRLTMCEVVDTEERYVSKLYNLVCEVAEEFRARAQGRAPSSTSPNENDLATLFPPCLNEIYDINMSFLQVIRNVLEDTERDAIADITVDTELSSSASQRSPEEERDAIGAVAFANALLEWFPKFSQPYGDYMRAHTAFTQTLNLFMRDKTSSFSKRVYETGEQRLRSLLMEPVQRLPRYSLLIDTMTSSLPLMHPAVRPLLKARDIIKDICSLDDPSSTNHDQGFQRLKELVDGWPSTILPTGRLITAVDFNELSPPYHMDSDMDSDPGILLLYKNCLVLLSKASGCRMTARGLMAELDNASSTAQGVAGPLSASAEIRVVQVYDLHTVRCMQSTCGRILFLAPASVTSKPSQNTTVDLLALEPIGMYGGRAGRIIEEIIKAKIEGRFSESERESGKWTLRCPTGTVGNLGILACVFEDEKGIEMNRPTHSKIRMMFDTSRTVCSQALNNSDLEVVISASLMDEDQYRVNVDSIVAASSSDIVTVDSFVPVLSKRLLNILQPLHDARNKTMTESLVHSNFAIIKYLAGHLVPQFKTSRVFRATSPTKLIANLLGGGHSRESSTSSSKGPSSATLLGEFPKMPPPRANVSRSNTLPSVFPGKEESPVKVSAVNSIQSKVSDSPFNVLEQVFAAYVLALQSRSGNIVGRTLRARGNVDRSSVNELYNVLLEDPAKLQAAAEVAVDTLFVAFETFMENAWKEHMGPVLDPSGLKVLQAQFDTMFPREFEECFRKFLADMSPQNRRALASLIRLLSDLLDASGSDGDRGALTAAFAEVLTAEGDPMEHISLLDRLVDDFDNLFEDFIPGGTTLEGILASEQTKPAQTSGSVGSNSSSFRKRFGFGLHRENSGESKVASILRTLSKNKGSNDAESGTPKNSSFVHSRSIDNDASLGPLLRPASRDRPGSSTSQELLQRPGSSQEEPMSSIICTNGGVRVRRKRRSSLSDLRPDTANTDASEGQRPTTPGSVSTARSTSPLKGSPPPRPGTPSRRSPVRPVTPSRKENVDPRYIPPDRSPRKIEDSVSPSQDLKRRSRAQSIPSKGPGLRERLQVNGSEIKHLQSSSSLTRSQRIRLQNPQKFRDRLLGERKTQVTTQLELKDELDLIAQELMGSRPSPIRLQPDTALVAGAAEEDTDASTAALASRVRNLELAFETMSGELTSRTSALERDLETSLVVSEKRAKKLDELYREASAENEALYGRFNSELGKLARQVRTGDGEEALKTQLSSALDEIGRLKKENFRLKREVGGLRAQQAAAALLRSTE